MISATALILTYNEETNIARTLRALSWIDEVVIIDSRSDDRTLEFAQCWRNRDRAARSASARLALRGFDHDQ